MYRAKVKKTQPARRVAVDSSDLTGQDDLWLCIVTTETDQQSLETPITAIRPTYKVDVIVNGVKTRALLDHGAQVSLARCQLIKERND